MTAKSLRHKFVNAQADGTDATVTRPSNWNDDHNLWLGGRVVTATSDTLADADHLSLVQYNSASAVAVSLPHAGGSGQFVAGWTVTILNLGAGALTITPTTSTINGSSSSITVAQSGWLTLYSDGTNYAASAVSVVPVASSTTPVMDGVAAIGIGTTWARADHVHPSDTTRVAISALADIGRNKIHNALFNVQQRGGGPFTVSGGYTLDRWQLAFNLDTGVQVSAGAVSDFARAAIGDEEAIWWLQLGTIGNAGAAAYTQVIQAIEGARRLSGKTITVSFWATASAPGLKLGVNGYTSFGTGGSPSAGVLWAATGTAIPLTTSWARYSATFTIPSTAGQTFGTAGNDANALKLFLSVGSTNSAAAGNIGVQSGTVYLWGVQLEIGSQATPLEKLDPRMDLANCQRFYQTGWAALTSYGPATAALGYQIPFPVPMRASPTIASNWTQLANCGSPATGPTNISCTFIATVTATGTFAFTNNFAASADL